MKDFEIDKKKVILNELIGKVESEIITFEINERYYARKVITDKNYESGLANIQANIKNAKDFLAFLKEVRNEK